MDRTAGQDSYIAQIFICRLIKKLKLPRKGIDVIKK